MLHLCAPLLLVINQSPTYQHRVTHSSAFPSIPMETGVFRIHSPHRILRGVGGGLRLVPNSTMPPVRTSASSVLVGFDVCTHDGDRWNARMISSGKYECDLFLMDSQTLQRKVSAKIKVVQQGNGHSIDTTLTLFDPAVLTNQSTLSLATVVRCMSRFNGFGRPVPIVKHELGLHRHYRRMAIA